MAESLERAIHGKGAFRQFKGCVHRGGLADRWCKFREEQYRRIALSWCEEHGIEADVGAN